MTLVQNIEGLNGNKVVNQFVVRIGSNTYFQSYDSIIARVDANGDVVVSERWDYSNTTRKYFYQFLELYSKYNIHSKKGMLKLLKEGKIKQTLDYKAIA